MKNKSLSNTISACIGLLLCAASAPAVADTLRIGGTGVALGGMRILGEAFAKQSPGTTVEVLPSIGSSGGVKALIAGAIDLAVTSRALKDAEKEQGVTARIYATTPLAIVTATDTQTDAITTRQLAEFYAGTTQTWPSGERVRVVLRPPLETDVQYLRSLSEDMARAVDAAFERPGLLIATNDQDNAETLENLPGSIGAVALGQIATEARKLKVLALDGIVPSAAPPEDQSLKDSEAYQRIQGLTRSLYLARIPNLTPEAEAFAAFVFSPEGQAILASYDHTPPQ